MSVFDDPVFLALIAMLVGFFFLVYLFIRRTILGFKEGMDQGKER